MLIGIDGNEANIKMRVGVNVYAYELLSGLARLQDDWKSKHKIVVYLKEKPRPDMPVESEYFKYKILPATKMWIVTKLTPELIIGCEKPVIFFSPTHNSPLFSTMPRVVSIMDLGYLNNTEQFTRKSLWQLTLWSAYSIKSAKKVIAISNFTKSDIVRHYPEASGKVSVTHLGYDKDRFNTKVSSNDVRRIKNKYQTGENYILFLSTLKPSKNVEGLIEAFRLIRKSGLTDQSLKLVVAGKKGWMYEPIYQKVKDLELEEKVIFTGFIPESEKPAIIAGAKIFVLPSFWEGFGMDILNAMACGVPVVASNIASIPEVAGGAAELINPKDSENIARGISKILNMSKLEYNKTIRKGLERVKEFSWDKCARETLKILEN